MGPGRLACGPGTEALAGGGGQGASPRSVCCLWSPGLGLGGVAEHQGAPPTLQGPWRQSWVRQVGGNCSVDLWIAFFSVSFSIFILNFFFLQIEIHPFSISMFYFMSLFCLFFFFNYTSSACSYLCALILFKGNTYFRKARHIMW